MNIQIAGLSELNIISVYLIRLGGLQLILQMGVHLLAI